MGDRIVNVQQVEVVELRNLSHARGQGQVVWREVKERITRDFYLVIANVGLRPRKTNRLRVRDEVDLMPTLTEFEPEVCGNYAAAPVRRVAGYPYLHPRPYGAPVRSLHATVHSMAQGERRCSFWSRTVGLIRCLVSAVWVQRYRR